PSSRGDHRADKDREEFDCAPVYIVTGGPGAGGQQILHGILAQFPTKNVPVKTVNKIRTKDEIIEVIAEVKAVDSFILHSMVEKHLRKFLIETCAEQGVTEIDLIGPLTEKLTEVLQVAPLEEPGRYHSIHQAFFERVDAIEYTLSEDDGQNVDGWEDTEILLVGVSRSGKTPLSVYLADHGWKVANYPIVKGVEPPRRLFEIDRRRVFGLDIEHDLLMMYRHQRQKTLGAPVGAVGYTDPLAAAEELEYARRIFKRGKFTVVDVTNKPVESIASEVARKMEKRFGKRNSGHFNLE
ncbi:MAG: kinase/pyrophosphorylase, partial [Anaerolineae bacterium]|nr:kinase/pyrophosphorylase [Anaerolineae bacterium]